jgi:hypothetical protein
MFDSRWDEQESSYKLEHHSLKRVYLKVVTTKEETPPLEFVHEYFLSNNMLELKGPNKKNNIHE